MLRLIVGVPVLVVLIIFALSNRAPVSIGFIGYAVVTPLSVAILVGAAIFFVSGAVLVWFGELAQRRRARRAERRVRQLEAELAELRARPAAPAITHASAEASPGALVPAS